MSLTYCKFLLTAAFLELILKFPQSVVPDSSMTFRATIRDRFQLIAHFSYLELIREFPIPWYVLQYQINIDAQRTPSNQYICVNDPNHSHFFHTLKLFCTFSQHFSKALYIRLLQLIFSIICIRFIEELF